MIDNMVQITDTKPTKRVNRLLKESPTPERRDRSADILRRIRRSSGQMSRLIEDLLDLADLGGDLLDLLDELNPVEARSGRRRTQINCVQFLDPDPLETLRRIAERHGGPNGYRFLSRSERGLTAP